MSVRTIQLVHGEPVILGGEPVEAPPPPPYVLGGSVLDGTLNVNVSVPYGLAVFWYTSRLNGGAWAKDENSGQATSSWQHTFSAPPGMLVEARVWAVGSDGEGTTPVLEGSHLVGGV